MMFLVFPNGYQVSLKAGENKIRLSFEEWNNNMNVDVAGLCGSDKNRLKTKKEAVRKVLAYKKHPNKIQFCHPERSEGTRF